MWLGIIFVNRLFDNVYSHAEALYGIYTGATWLTAPPTLEWIPYRHNVISYTSKMASLYWIRAQVPSISVSIRNNYDTTDVVAIRVLIKLKPVAMRGNWIKPSYDTPYRISKLKRHFDEKTLNRAVLKKWYYRPMIKSNGDMYHQCRGICV